MDFRDSPLLRRLIFSSGFRFLGMIAAAIAGLVLAPYMFNKLGGNDCGLMVLVGTIVSIIALLEAGLNSAISRHVAAAIGANDDSKLRRCFNSGFFLFCGTGLAIVLIATLIAWNIEGVVRSIQEFRAYLYSDTSESVLDHAETFGRNIRLMRILLVILSFQFAVELILRSLVGVVSGALRTDIVSVAVMTLRILRPVVSFVILYLGGGVISLTLAGCAITVSLAPFWYFVATSLVPQLRVSFRFVDLETVKELYRYSFFAFLSFLSRNFHTSVAIIVLSSMYGLGTVAIYQMICVTLYSYGTEVIMMLTQYLSPVFAHLGARKENETMRKALFFAIKVSAGAALFVTFGLIAWGHPFILRWMCGEDPQRIVAYPPLVLMALIILFEQSQAPTVEFLYGTATHRYYARVNMIEAALAILMFPYLAYRFELLGIAASLLAACLVARLILQPYYVCKVLEIPMRNYYTRLFSPMIRGACCLLLPTAATVFLIDDSYPKLFAVGLLSAALYGPSYFFLGFDRDERDLVWNAVFKR